MNKKPGDFEILLLMALLRLKEGAYGAEVHREIEDRTGRSIAVGAVYTGFARLEHGVYLCEGPKAGQTAEKIRCAHQGFGSPEMETDRRKKNTRRD